MSAAISLANVTKLGDGELVQTAVAGREASFEELVRRYQRPIAAYVYRMVGDYDAALDLTQEVFIKVYNSLARYRSEFKFSTWIYKIAHNAAIDHLRRHAVREQTLTGSVDGERREVAIESRRLTPEQESERKERRSEIESVVQLLQASYRELIPSAKDGEAIAPSHRSPARVCLFPRWPAVSAPTARRSRCRPAIRRR